MTLVQIALEVLNACAAGAEPNAEDVLTLRYAVGPDAAGWYPEVVAAHIIAEEARRAARVNRAGAS